jgi:hypothetical protein
LYLFGEVASFVAFSRDSRMNALLWSKMEKVTAESCVKGNNFCLTLTDESLWLKRLFLSNK